MLENESLVYLVEAMSLLNEYEEISLSDYMLEDVDEKIQNNDKVEKGVVESLKKAISAIIKFINDIIQKIKDVFQRIFKPKDAKNVLDQCEDVIKENPELKGEQVEIIDLKKVDAEYENALAEMDKAEKEEADTSVFENILSKLKGNIGKIALVTVGSVVAINYCRDNSKIITGKISSILEKEGTACKTLELLIGKDNTKDFRKKMKKHGAKAYAKRQKAKLNNERQRTFFANLKYNINAIKHLINSMKKGKLDNDDLDYTSELLSSKTGEKVLNAARHTAAFGLKTKVRGDKIKDKIDKTKKFFNKGSNATVDDDGWDKAIERMKKDTENMKLEKIKQSKK